jgi:FkbM family methyltransferase
MYIPPADRNLDLTIDQYEPGVSECLRNLLKPGMVFCDVGANFGIFTLLGSRAVGPKGRVFAFEPVPSNRRVLERNIALNGVTNVTVIAEAVSDTCGSARIFLSRDAGCHSISTEPLHYEGEFLDVVVTRLDQVKSIERIDVLKIDVEGVELEVLAGLGDLKVNQVILEYNSERIAKRGMTGQEFLGRLKELGFINIVNLDHPSSGLASLSEAGDTTVNLLVSSKEPSTAG